MAWWHSGSLPSFLSFCLSTPEFFLCLLLTPPPILGLWLFADHCCFFLLLSICCHGTLLCLFRSLGLTFEICAFLDYYFTVTLLYFLAFSFLFFWRGDTEIVWAVSAVLVLRTGWWIEIIIMSFTPQALKKKLIKYFQHAESTENNALIMEHSCTLHLDL